MPTKFFFELNDSKKQTILSTAIAEFATCGFTNASTNIIVKKAGISKGSLFKYFAGKEDLYFFILDTVTEELIGSLNKQTATLSSELFQRVIDYSALEFSWYAQNPEKSKLIINAFAKSDTEIYQKTIKRYALKDSDIYYKLLEDIDLSNFRWDRQKTIDILKWFLKGFNEDFLEHISNETASFEHLHNEYVRKLTEYMEILKTGLLK